MIQVHIPIRLPSLANSRLHWRRLAALKKEQREWTALALRDVLVPSPPLVVIVTRIGPRRLDDDNLVAACKYIRDQIASEIGIDDGSPLYTWVYKQRIGKYGVNVEIMPR